ncbi:MAG: hypothetical protein ACRC4W_09550 [Treponemataceae bacterium]
MKIFFIMYIILLGLSYATANSSQIYTEPTIIMDKTVSIQHKKQIEQFNFQKNDFESFLLKNNLYVQKTEKVWYISKIRIIENDEGLLQIDAKKTDLQSIFDKITEVCTIPVVFGKKDLKISTKKITIHLANITEQELVEILLLYAKGFYLTNKDNYFLIAKK